MMGNKSAFVTTLRKGDDDILWNIMVLHTQVLCSKVWKFDHVMDMAFKIVNSISHSFSRPYFRVLLKECDHKHSELFTTY